MNKIETCFKVIDDYNRVLREKIMQNDLPKDVVNEIYSNLEAKNDITISLNKTYKLGHSLEDFSMSYGLEPALVDALQMKYPLYMHQENAIKSIMKGKSTIISTGTGSGKTESFLIPILNYCFKHQGYKGVKAIIVYPMNALAGDQNRRILEAVQHTDITCEVLNGEVPWNKDVKGQKDVTTREMIIAKQPDILITNFKMLDLMLTDPRYIPLFNSSDNVFKYIVLDEIHTYKGNKALDIKYLLHRTRAKFNTNIVQIGCSATLDRTNEGEATGGYIVGSKEVNTFIQNMFDLKEGEYEYVEPIFMSLEELNYKNDDAEYMSLASNPKVQLIKSSLYNHSYSFNELLEVLNNNELFTNREELKDLLNEIVVINNKHTSQPILDFRVHIFLLQLGDKVRRCAHCGKYYTTAIDNCNNCGHIVLPIYRKNINLLMGNLSKGYITAASADKKMQDNIADDLLVFLNFNTDKPLTKYKHILNFDTYDISNDKIKLDIDIEGKYQVCMDDSLEYDAIILNQDHKSSDQEFSYHILSNNLRNLEDKDKRILLFKDNRENCGRYSNTYTDCAYSEFFFEIVKYISSNTEKSIIDIYNEVTTALNEFVNNNDTLDKDIAKEFEFWFRRFLREDAGSSISRNFANKLTQDELNVLEVAIKEALYFDNKIGDNSKYITLFRANYKYDKGLSTGTIQCNGPKPGYISLSEKGRKYSNTIKEVANIEATVGMLVSKRYLREGNVKGIYYLNKTMIKFKPLHTVYSSIKEIAENTIFISKPHSSEVNGELRKEFETGFQSGKINALVATPTLEMGIDIGKLSTVYMLGVPPAPSNYCQRAGRAGRSSDKFAMILTLCSEANSHDWYYYCNPKEIIEGTITPPVFDIYNKLVLRKHINTYLYIRNGQEYELNEAEIIRTKQELEEYFMKVFNPRFKIDLDANIAMIKNILETADPKLLKDPYKCGIFPDYGFSTDEIILQNEDGDKISNREMDVAYKNLDIGKPMFIGNKNYVLNPISLNKLPVHTDEKGISTANNIIDIKKICCVEEKNHINAERTRAKKESYIIVFPNKGQSTVNYTKNPNIIFMGYLENATLQFVAEHFETVVTNLGGLLNPKFGYETNTNVIMFRFATDIISKAQATSFMAALYKSIIKNFGLDEQELGFAIDEEVYFKQKKTDEKYLYGILYDKTGNKNIDMENIMRAMNDDNITGEFMQDTVNTLTKCTCDSTAGCHLCIKSFNTQRMYGILDKYKAINFVEFLMQRAKLSPSISMTQCVLDRYEKTIDIRHRGDFYISYDHKEHKLESSESQNETVMFALAKILRELYLNDIYSIRVISNVDRFINGLNGTGKINDSSSFKYCIFYKQAFVKFVADKA